jgi:hypothetical protein
MAPRVGAREEGSEEEAMKTVKAWAVVGLSGRPWEWADETLPLEIHTSKAKAQRAKKKTWRSRIVRVEIRERRTRKSK